MDWAPQVLVVILSVFLALFLLLSIVLVVLLIKVTKQIKTVTTSAERTVVKLEEAATNASTYTSLSFLAKAAKNFMSNKK